MASGTAYFVGDSVILTATFTVAGVLTDPAAVSLIVTDPSANQDTYTYGGGTVTKSSTGVYTKTVALDESGTWEYRWVGTGSAAGAAQGNVRVVPVNT